MAGSPRFFLCGVLFVIVSGCTVLFPRDAGKSLAHFDAAAPAERSPAPLFRLVDIEGRPFSLQNLVGKRPVVIQLGSYSCPVFRYRRFDMQKLQQEFAGRVEFVVVYTQEAHPVDAINPYTDTVWNPLINKVARVNVAQHRSLEERRAKAAATFEFIGFDSRFLVDGMNNDVWRQYGAAPSPAYVLDLEGNIHLRQAWVYPGDIRRALNDLLSR